MAKKTTILGKVVPTHQKEFDANREYQKLDVFTYQGSSFLVDKRFKGIEYLGNTEYVKLLASKGDKGDPLKFIDLTDEQKEELRGEQGRGLTIIARFDTFKELKEAIPDPGIGDAYGVRNPEDPSVTNIYIYDVIIDDWRDYGPIEGAAGKSAYEYYLEAGGTLSVTDFAKALSEVGEKVNKEEGKGLSSNDYTTEEKDKLASIDEGANYYVHPVDEFTQHVAEEDITTWHSKADGDHHHDDLYQPLGNYQQAGDYAAASHNHDEKYQEKGNYQVAGSYASSDHNHDAAYQAKGDYAASGHNHDSTYVKQESGKALSTNDFTADYKARLDAAVAPTKDIQTVTSLASLPLKYNIKCTYSTSTPTAISFASTPAEGFETILSILNNTSADITQAIPNAAGWQSEEDSVTLAAGKITEISIRYVHGKYIVRT